MDIDDDSEKLINVKSKDGKFFQATMQQLRLCGTIQEMLETLGDHDNIDEIPLLQIDSFTLEKVLTYTEKYKDVPQPTLEEIKNKKAETISDWDEEFLQMPLASLYDLISAANFLSIPGLLWLTTRQIAYMIKGKDPEEIRQLFGISNDWSPYELERVQRENSYCEEYRE